MNDTLLRLTGIAIAIGGAVLGMAIILALDRRRFARTGRHLVVALAGWTAFVRALQAWRRDPACATALGTRGAWLLGVGAVATALAGAVLEQHLPGLVRRIIPGFWMLSIAGDFCLDWLWALCMPGFLVGLTASVIVRGGWGRLAGGAHAAPVDAHGALMVPAALACLAASSLGVAAPLTFHALVPQSAVPNWSGDGLRILERLLLYTAASTTVPFLANGSATRKVLMGRYFKLFAGWWGAHVALYFILPLMGPVFQGLLGKKLGESLGSNASPLVWSAVYFMVFPIVWLKSEARGVCSHPLRRV